MRLACLSGVVLAGLAFSANTGKVAGIDESLITPVTFRLAAAPGPAIVALRNFSDSIMDRSLCLTSGAGQSAAYSCGDLVVSHALPGYRTMGRERSLTLIYNSGTAQPQPVIVAAVTEGGTTTIPNSVELQLTVNGTVVSTATYPGSGWGTGPLATRQVAIGYDATAGTPTGAYPFSLRVRNVYTGISTVDVTRTGILLVVNRSTSAFGKGVGIAGVEQLIPGQPSGATSLMWIGGDGSARLYRSTANPSVWAAPSGAYQDTIKLVSGVYTRYLRHNVKVAFDASGHHISTTNQAGHVTSFFWAPTRLDSIKVPPAVAGTRYALFYGSDSRLDSIVDPQGRTLTLTIGSGGLLAKVADPDAFETVFSYVANTGLMSARTTRRGNTTRYVYANGRRLTKVTIPVGRSVTDTATSVTRFAPWDEKGLVTPIDTSNGYTAIYGPRFRATAPAVSDTAAFWVNRYGAPTRIVGPLGFQTTIKREDSRFPALATKVIYPSKQVTVVQYDVRANVLQVRDSSDVALPAASRLPTKATTYVYGSIGSAFQDMPTRVVDSTATAGQPLVTTFVYDATTGLTKQATAPNTHVTKFAYSSQAKSLNLVKAVTELAVPVWDADGDSLVVDSLHTGFAFNGVGNITSDTSPSGRVNRYALDVYQRVSDHYDPADHRTQYVYDLLNRTTLVSEYGTGTTLLARTTTTIDTDVVTQVKDLRNVTRSWDYDLADQPISETDDIGNTELRFYNRASLLDSVQDRIGGIRRYVYDAAGQLSRKVAPARIYVVPSHTIPADSIVYLYDNMGRMTSAAMADTTLGQPKKIVRTYFARGELKSETQSLLDGTNQFTHTYRYDRLGRRTGYTIGIPGSVPYSDDITYNYNTLGELGTMSVKWRGKATATETITFGWDPLGRRDSVGYRKGQYVRLAYDRDGAVRLVCGSDTRLNPPNDDVMRFTVHDTLVDAEGLVLQTKTVLKRPTWMGCGGNTVLSYTQDNTYDERHQMATTTRNGVAHVYTYDKSGNMTRDDKTGTTEDADFVIAASTNRLLQRNPSSGTVKRYGYYADGARADDCPGLTGCDTTNLAYRKYYYDGFGRMVGTDEWAQRGAAPPEYDPLGRMTRATDEPARLGYDGDNVVRTGFDDANASWTFIHGPGTDDPLVARYAILSAGQLAEEQIAYYGTDGQGRQYAAADTIGNDAALRYDGWPKGAKYAGGTVNAGGFDADRSSSTAMKGLSFFRNRFYDSETGRWTQEDPIGVAGGFNLYRFNGNNPVTYSDPFGLCPPKDSNPCSEREEGWGDNDAGFADPTSYVGPVELKLGAALMVGMVSDAGKVAFEGAIGRIFAGLSKRFGAAVERTLASGAKQAEFTVAEDGTKMILRGPETHPIPGSNGEPVTHYNVEVQKPTRKPGGFKTAEDTHLDANGRVLDP